MLARTVLLAVLAAIAACGASATANVRSDAREADVAAVQADLRGRVNAERARLGLAPLEDDPTLDRIALAHSEDMRDNGFVGHDSPSTGTPAGRVERAGLGRIAVLENVARGDDADALWTSFGTISQRDNMRNAQSTHTGIGIAVQRNADGVLLFATELFAQLGHEIDVASAPARVQALLDAARRSRGLAALRADVRLDQVAGAAAREFFQAPAPDEADIVARANQRLAPLAASYRKVGTVSALVHLLDESVALEPSLDADARAIGVGVAQGAHPTAGPYAIAVVLIWAK